MLSEPDVKWPCECAADVEACWKSVFIVHCNSVELKLMFSLSLNTLLALKWKQHFFYVCVSLRVFLYMRVSLHACFSMCVSVYMCVSLCVCFTTCVFLYVPVSLCVCFSMHVFHSSVVFPFHSGWGVWGSGHTGSEENSSHGEQIPTPSDGGGRGGGNELAELLFYMSLPNIAFVQCFCFDFKQPGPCWWKW